MKTTDYQARVLARLEDGGVIEVRSPIVTGRVPRFWIGEDVIDTRTVQRLLGRGWITATRHPPGGKRVTGRAVITKLGRQALGRFR